MWVKDRDYIWEQVGAKLVGCQAAQLAQIYDCEPSHVITGNQCNRDVGADIIDFDIDSRSVRADGDQRD